MKSTCKGQVFSFSLLSILAWVCHKQPLLCWDMFSLCQLWRESLTWMDEFCQMLFSASIEMIMWFLSFLLLMWYITMIDLWIRNPSYNLRINPTWSWYMILFIYSWIPFANIFFKDLCIYINQRYWPIIFSAVSLDFSIRAMLVSLIGWI